MAHFAKIDTNNVVTQVIKVNNSVLTVNGVENEALGAKFCSNLFEGTWIQTSYTGKIRKNFASKDFTYDRFRKVFVPKKPYASWILDENTCQWQAPKPLPDSTNTYVWDEKLVTWTIPV